MLLKFQTLFPDLINIIELVYRGGRAKGDGLGGRGGWGAEAGLFHTFEQKSSHCLLIEVYKQPQADTVADSSLTPSLALLAHPSDTVNSIIGCHEFTRSQKSCQ